LYALQCSQLIFVEKTVMVAHLGAFNPFFATVPGNFAIFGKKKAEPMGTTGIDQIHIPGI